VSKRRRIETEKDLVLAFADLFDEIGPGAPEEMDAELREVGFDLDEVTARVLTVVKRTLADSPLNWRNRSRELEKQRSSRASFALFRQRTREENEATLRKLAPAFYRNLNEISDDDLASLLADLEYLDTWEQGQAERGEVLE